MQKVVDRFREKDCEKLSFQRVFIVLLYKVGPIVNAAFRRLVIFPNGLPFTVTELRGQSKEKTSEEEQHSPHAHSLLPSCAMNAAQNKISANNLLCKGNSMYTL